jgi:hypothetical protein
MTFDYNKLKEAIERTKRMSGTDHIYDSISADLFELNKNLELLDFIDREPLIRWLLSRNPEATDWPMPHPNVRTVAPVFLTAQTALFWIVGGRYVDQWMLAQIPPTDIAHWLGPTLDVYKILPLLDGEVSAHEIAEATRLSRMPAEEGCTTATEKEGASRT